MDQEQESNASVNKNVGKFMTDELKEAWRKFMEKFQQSFNLDQLDPVLSYLRESESNFLNPSKKKSTEFSEEENNSQNDHAALLEKRVFGNHLLAKSVFKYLSDFDLLSCRLMNSYWNEYATEVLLKGELKITFTRKSNRFYLSGSNWKSLDMFTQLLRTSKQFPCTKFYFGGGNLGNDDAQRFFSFYGSSIKTIKINIYCHEDPKEDAHKSEAGFSVGLTDSRVIGRILTHQLVNLEELDMDISYPDENEWSGFESLLFPPGEKVELPSLKKLTYQTLSGAKELRQLLVAATNLKSFSSYGYFDMDVVDIVIETGKVKCIDCVGFPEEAKHLQKLQEMVKNKPEVSVLFLFNLIRWYKKPKSWNRISTILTQLLKSSQKSLNTIFGLNNLGFLPQFSLPILENVTELSLVQTDDYDSSFLPSGATFSGNFPRLYTLSIGFRSQVTSENAAERWSKYFTNDEIILTVKKFRISNPHHCSCLWMEKFSKMFPNVEDLTINRIKDFQSFSKTIWTSFSKLKSLTVEIDLSSPSNFYPALDSSFTGLSHEVCKKLGELSTTDLESMAENYMGNEPSLLNLTDLRTLEIHLNFYSEVSSYDYSKILTPVTGISVFRPLNNLQQVHIWGPKKDHDSFIRCLKMLTPFKVKLS